MKVDSLQNCNYFSTLRASFVFSTNDCNSPYTLSANSTSFIALIVASATSLALRFFISKLSPIASSSCACSGVSGVLLFLLFLSGLSASFIVYSFCPILSSSFSPNSSACSSVILIPLFWASFCIVSFLLISETSTPTCCNFFSFSINS